MRFRRPGKVRCGRWPGVSASPGDDVEKRCRVLSGGEKARLVMALMLYDPPNFLVLDEPTNHLDIATKQMLIAALSEYEGTMLFVSHDRHFLAALSNRLLELTPEGIHQYGGGYTEYVARTGHEGTGPAELMRRARRRWFRNQFFNRFFKSTVVTNSSARPRWKARAGSARRPAASAARAATGRVRRSRRGIFPTGRRSCFDLVRPAIAHVGVLIAGLHHGDAGFGCGFHRPESRRGRS